MKKRIWLVILTVLVAIMTAGCGDGFKGDWMHYQEGFRGDKYIEVLHLEAADSGGYIVTVDQRGYEHERNDAIKRDTADDGSKILNFNEAIQVVKRDFFRSDYNWNGTPLKLARKYKWKYTKYERTFQIKKEDLSLKDGKLYYQGAVFEKTDEKKLGKIKEEWKNTLTGQLGKEIKINVNRLKGAKAVLAKITIVENGKEEVFE